MRQLEDSRLEPRSPQSARWSPRYEITADIEPESSATAQVRTYLEVLQRRWRLVASFTAAAVVLMAIGCFFAQRLYTAKAVLHVKTQPPNVTNIPQVVAPPSYLEGVEYFQDQIKFLESKTLAATVLKDLDLQHDPGFVAQDRGPGVLETAMSGVGSVFGWVRGLFGGTTEEPAGPAPEAVYDVPSSLITRYQRALEVKPIMNSRLVEVSFTSPSPALSQKVANAHVRGYIHKSLQSKFELTGEARKFLESEIDRVQNDLAYAERALNDFRRQNHVVSLDERENAVADRLTDLSRRLTDAQATRIGTEAEYQLVKSREYDSLPSVLTNALIQGLKQETSRLEVRQAELGAIFLPASPQLQEVNSQLGSARQRLKRELERAAAGIESQYLAAVAKENSLKAEFEAQQNNVLNLKEISGQYIRLDQAVNTTRTLYNTLVTRLQETDVVKGVQLSSASVMDPADLPRGASYPAVWFNLLFATLFGAGLGVVCAFVLESTDASLKTPEDVRAHLRLPTLGVVPDFARLPTRDTTGWALPVTPARGVDGRPVALEPVADRSIRTEAFRSIRTSILFFNPEKPPRSILVTSSQPQEGKTSTTVHLALSLAQLSQSVVVVDADMRQPRCHRELGVPPAAGLSEVLRGQDVLGSTIQRFAVHNGRAVRLDEAHERAPRLDLLQAGRPPGDPSALLGTPQMEELLRSLLETYGVVLIDSPPVFPITDSAILAPRVDGVVFVVRGHLTDRRVTREALERLEYMQAKVMGVVLNGVDPGSRHYQSYRSYYFAA